MTGEKPDLWHRRGTAGEFLLMCVGALMILTADPMWGMIGGVLIALALCRWWIGSRTP